MTELVYNITVVKIERHECEREHVWNALQQICVVCQVGESFKRGGDRFLRTQGRVYANALVQR